MPPLPLDPPAATEPPNQSRVCYPGVLARGGVSVGVCDGPFRLPVLLTSGG